MDQREQDVLSTVPTTLWIGGRPCDPVDAATFAVTDPSTGETLLEVADAGPADAALAMDAAAGAQAEWAATAPRRRSEVLRAAWALVTERAEDLALLMTLEMGKALAESRAEITYGAEFLRWFAEEAVRIDGRFTPSPGGTGQILVTRQPVGPCLAITPWNFPLAMGTRKLGPRPGGGLHDDRQAGRGDAVDHARAGGDPGRGGPARRGAQRAAHLARGRGHRADHRRPPGCGS